MRLIYEIAREIEKDWGKAPSGVWFGARPYLDAMHTMNEMEDGYLFPGWDAAASVLDGFRANAQTWRGETARRVKKELKEMV